MKKNSFLLIIIIFQNLYGGIDHLGHNLEFSLSTWLPRSRFLEPLKTTEYTNNLTLSQINLKYHYHFLFFDNFTGILGTALGAGSQMWPNQQLDLGPYLSLPSLICGISFGDFAILGEYTLNWYPYLMANGSSYPSTPDKIFLSILWTSFTLPAFFNSAKVAVTIGWQEEWQYCDSSCVNSNQIFSFNNEGIFGGIGLQWPLFK